MPDFYEYGASSVAVPSAAQSLAELSVQDLMALPPKPVRPSWMLQSRYPVSIEEFARLNEIADQPDPVPATLEGGAYGDLDAERAEVTGIDLPEDMVPAAAAPAQAPTLAASFQGIPATNWQPPDNTMAVGPNDVLVAVNTDLAGYTKSGQLRFRWPNMTPLFQRVLPQGASIFDPRVAYDHYAQRWIVVVAARRETPAGSWVLIAASQGTDPAGAWWIWALDATLDGSTQSNNWADYPMLGFDTQAVYLSFNMFAMGGGYAYTKLRILNKTELYGGLAIRWYDFWNLKNPDNSLAFTIQPCVHFRGTGGAPPAYLINGIFPGGDALILWTLSNPLALWQGGTPSLTRDRIACQAYDHPPEAEQPGTATRVTTNDARLLNAIFQNAGGTERVWTCHTSKITWSGDSLARSAAQWYEIDIPSKQVVQQNAFGQSGAYYFFPAIITDMRRNAYLVYTRSSVNEFASLRQTGRLVSDPVNTMQGSGQIKAGVSAYTRGRWGDYFGVARDGADANRVWVYGEFADERDNWGTWIAALTF